MSSKYKSGDIVRFKKISGDIINLKVMGVIDRGTYNQLEVSEIFKSGKVHKRKGTLSEHEVF